jgi:hypothetical protein
MQNKLDFCVFDGIVLPHEDEVRLREVSRARQVFAGMTLSNVDDEAKRNNSTRKNKVARKRKKPRETPVDDDEDDSVRSRKRRRSRVTTNKKKKNNNKMKQAYSTFLQGLRSDNQDATSLRVLVTLVNARATSLSNTITMKAKYRHRNVMVEANSPLVRTQALKHLVHKIGYDVDRFNKLIKLTNTPRSTRALERAFFGRAKGMKALVRFPKRRAFPSVIPDVFQTAELALHTVATNKIDGRIAECVCKNNSAATHVCQLSFADTTSWQPRGELLRVVAGDEEEAKVPDDVTIVDIPQSIKMMSVLFGRESFDCFKRGASHKFGDKVVNVAVLHFFWWIDQYDLLGWAATCQSATK